MNALAGLKAPAVVPITAAPDSRVVASASAATALRSGRTTFSRLRSDAPLALMPTPEALYVVGSAAGPLNGDSIELDLEIGAGTELTVRSVAATMAFPGRSGAESRVVVRARVAAGGTLHWLPEPVIAVAGAKVRIESHVELAAGASVRWREQFVLGRSGEDPGTLTALTHVSSEGAPVLRQQLGVGPLSTFSTPSVGGGARATGSLFGFGPGPGAPTTLEAPPGVDTTLLEPEGGGWMVTALASAPHLLTRLFDDLELRA